MARQPLSTMGQGEAVRREIVAAANRLFYHRGYNQTSFSDIAQAAGIPRGNFYYYFKSKDDILGAVIDARIESIRAMLAAWDAAEPDPRLRLQRFGQMILGSEKDLVRYGCPMGSLNIELGKAQPALKAKAKKMFDLFIDWLTRQLAALGQEQAARLAMNLMARAQGVAVMTQVYGDREFLRAQLAEFDAWIASLSG
jgi:AcrR family transcriptional regulator